jgi:hypothetical protein
MNSATVAGVVSIIVFATSTLPTVVRAARDADVSSYSRGHLLRRAGRACRARASRAN